MPTDQLPGRRLRVLDEHECRVLLRRAYVGRLAFVVDDRPRIVPMNYLVDRDAVLLRTGRDGLLDVIDGRDVAFEVDDVSPDDHAGWSVVVTGRAEEVREPGELERVGELPLRPWAPGDRTRYVRIATAGISGRRIG